ncbi:hypothetical protein MTX78_24410 (plasmid) [Hymenobacter tibetensis]|uniref:Uncharacterized protein n=1 Tax=Hymenobacter tibetensis TaxID=497967 RepID=A0ABY4D5K6_9BACT|nr:hypothetical protein [Hymenobacter tibetensis]UOG77492.1 hypothetical protein MTX78_24410 [Hymenobacter tibetensis]
MAKSFKQLSTDTTQSAKPTSEKDILDFLEQDWLTPASPAAPTSQAATSESQEKISKSGQRKTSNNTGKPSNLSNTNNTSNTSNSTADVPRQSSEAEEIHGKGQRRVDAKEGKPNSAKKASVDKPIAAVTDVVDATEVTTVTNVTPEHDVDVRQTFVLSQQYLEGLKNYVHTKRMSGQYDFTQKQALHQALDLLFATAQIEERPLQIRQKEEVRRQQIRKGKLK